MIEQLKETRHHRKVIADPVGDHASVEGCHLVGVVLAGQLVNGQPQPFNLVDGIVYAGFPPCKRSIIATSRATDRLVSSTSGTIRSTIACQR